MPLYYAQTISSGGGSTAFTQGNDPGAVGAGSMWLRSATGSDINYHNWVDNFGQALFVRSSDNSQWLPTATVVYDGDNAMRGLMTIGQTGTTCIESFNSDGSSQASLFVGEYDGIGTFFYDQSGSWYNFSGGSFSIESYAVGYTAQLFNDGSASFNNGAIIWDASGNVAIQSGKSLAFNGIYDYNWRIGRNYFSGTTPTFQLIPPEQSTLNIAIPTGTNEGFSIVGADGTIFCEMVNTNSISGAGAWALNSSVQITSQTPGPAITALTLGSQFEDNDHGTAINFIDTDPSVAMAPIAARIRSVAYDPAIAGIVFDVAGIYEAMRLDPSGNLFLTLGEGILTANQFVGPSYDNYNSISIDPNARHLLNSSEMVLIDYSGTYPTVGTPPQGDNSTNIATTAFVQENQGIGSTWNYTSGYVDTAVHKDSFDFSAYDGCLWTLTVDGTPYAQPSTTPLNAPGSISYSGVLNYTYQDSVAASLISTDTNSHTTSVSPSFTTPQASFVDGDGSSSAASLYIDFSNYDGNAWIVNLDGTLYTVSASNIPNVAPSSLGLSFAGWIYTNTNSESGVITYQDVSNGHTASIPNTPPMLLPNKDGHTGAGVTASVFNINSTTLTAATAITISSHSSAGSDWAQYFYNLAINTQSLLKISCSSSTTYMTVEGGVVLVSDPNFASGVVQAVSLSLGYLYGGVTLFPDVPYTFEIIPLNWLTTEGGNVSGVFNDSSGHSSVEPSNRYLVSSLSGGGHATVNWDNCQLYGQYGGLIADWFTNGQFKLAGQLNMQSNQIAFNNPYGQAFVQAGSFGTFQGVSLVCYIGYELNWQNGHLSSWDGEGFYPIYIDSPVVLNNTTFNDVDDEISIDPNARQLFTNYGSLSIDYQAKILYNTPGALASVDWANRYLIDSSGVVSSSWDSRVLVDYSGNNSVDWGNRYLIDNYDVAAINWSNRTLTDIYYSTILDWSTPGQLLIDGDLLLQNHVLSAYKTNVQQYTLDGAVLDGSYTGTTLYTNGVSGIYVNETASVGTNITVIQGDGNTITFLGYNGSTLMNRLGNTRSAGQYAVCNLVVVANDSGNDAFWILSGDTVS